MILPISLYNTTFALLLAFSLGLFLLQRTPEPDPNTNPSLSSPPPPPPPPSQPQPSPSTSTSATPFPNQSRPSRPSSSSTTRTTTAFLAAYTLAAASDWLQGAHLYPLYRSTHALPAPAVSLLFVAGFASAALSAAFVGAWADRRGRRRACLWFCVAYAGGCALTAGGGLTAAVVVIVGGGGGYGDGDGDGVGGGLMGEGWGKIWGLVLGRVLGGVGTSLMMCSFESWLVGAVGRGEGPGRGEEELGRVMGLMSGLNSAAAIVCGIVSEWVVEATETRKAPFWLAVGVLGLAWVVIWWFWDENYGATERTTDNKGEASRLRAVLLRPQVLALCLASTVFEGSMYLFVFFWAPALKSVQSSHGELPYGVVFSSFMAATLASSLAFNSITKRQLVRHTTLLVAILGVSAACFFLSAKPGSELSAFWIFCLFEAAVGMYWPCMGYLKGKLIDDGVRAQVYGMLRIPLNIFVVVSLLITGDGDAFGKVFSFCSTLLLASSGALWFTLRSQGAGVL